jgi:RNA polymerase sigma-70 factor (ECF subfamily)
MPISESGNAMPQTHASFGRLLDQLRPKLHRYCARMTGSVIDGEDLVQDTLVKAIEAFDASAAAVNPEAWLFRIAHNAAIDFLRRRARHLARHSTAETDAIADSAMAVENREIAASSLRTFMRLPVTQRSSIILMDVLGYSLLEISGVTGSTIPAIKTAVHRGRARLREFTREPDDRPLPVLNESERALLANYIDRFNARDFDAVRDMLAEEVRLDLVDRKRARGRTEVASYFHNYGRAEGWQLVLGLVDRRPAILVRNPDDPSGHWVYFILLQWVDGRVVSIRDFAHARYVVEGADTQPLR